MDSKSQPAGVRSTERDSAGTSSDSASSAFVEVTQEADQGAVRPLYGVRPSEPASSASVEVTEEADEGAVHPLLQASGADSLEPALTGTGFTYRHNWGRRRGPHTLRLNWAAIDRRSRVFVSIGEGAAGGPDNGKFIGSARYTLHNVAPRAGAVHIWVNIEWGSDILLYVDYLVVNP